jgi:Putative prokaryotic signal transducing protein
MICPNCKCEYIRGVTQCADCGVPLVNALESPQANFPEAVRLVPIWRGKDHAECERVIEALESAGIPHTDPDSKSFFSFLPTDPNTEIWVSDADEERARKILLDLEGLVYPEESTSEEIEPFALPESEDPDGDEQTSQSQDLLEDWHEDDPVAEVWSGDREDFADGLMACFREVGIASHKHSEGIHWRVVVRPEMESRAKEIVHEVMEASPPE